MSRLVRSCRCAGPAAVLALALSLATAGTVAGQSDATTSRTAGDYGPAVQKFEILPSPIGLRGPVRPDEYVGVTSPKAAWLGSETGEGEIWVHPLKVAADFRLAFQVPEYRDPIPGAEVARRVEIRPALTTVTYSHASFQVKQHILAPASHPGLLMLLDVETVVPLEVVVEFQPILQLAWPGGFGGQYIYWDQGNGVFVLSESLRQRTAVLGSPWATDATTHPAHKLSEAPSTFVISVDPERAKGEFIPIAVAGGFTSREDLMEVYHEMLATAPVLYREKRAWADSVLTSTTSIDSPDDRLDLALEWAKINLEEQRVCNPELGCGLVAGWGRSGSSARPGFGWYFGGDAAINSLAMDAVGQWELVAEGLRFLARYRREDGKMPHEISQAAPWLPWFEEYPYPYYHADTTPYWMLALWYYWRASGDDALVDELWPAYLDAYNWCLTAETDGDGIIENTVGGLGAIEVGQLGAAMHQDVYLASVWTGALEGTVELARARGDGAMAAEAASLLRLARRTLNDAYWREEEGHHAFGILASGETNDNLTAWPAIAASYGLLDPERASATLRKLATDSISADWGAHMLSTGSPLFDPLHYNNGTVWPFVTGFVSWGQYRYGRPWAGYHLVDAVKQITFDWSLGRHGELFSGRYYQPLDQTVPHQFFATSMLVTPLLRGILGWEPNAPANAATLAPQLPPSWPRLRVERLRVGETTISVDIRQGPGGVTAEFRGDGPAVEITYVQALPPGAEDALAVIDADRAAGDIERGPSGLQVRSRFTLDGRRTVQLQWTGGLSVEPPHFDLVPGQRSRGYRVVDFQVEEGGWLLTLEGEAGRSYQVDLYGEAVTAQGAEVGDFDSESGRTNLRVRFPQGAGRTLHTVMLRPTRLAPLSD